jgi:hypothetical protein
MFLGCKYQQQASGLVVRAAEGRGARKKLLRQRLPSGSHAEFVAALGFPSRVESAHPANPDIGIAWDQHGLAHPQLVTTAGTAPLACPPLALQ